MHTLQLFQNFFRRGNLWPANSCAKIYCLCLAMCDRTHENERNALNTNRYYLLFHNIDVTTMCSVKNVNNHASLTISCIVNCRQSQYFQIVGGPKTLRGTKWLISDKVLNKNTCRRMLINSNIFLKCQPFSI